MSTQLQPYVENLASAVITAVEQRKLANQAARRTNLNPEFRTTGAYPVYWLQNLSTVETNAVDRVNRIARNTSILATVSEIVIDLPVVKPDNADCILALKKPGAADFQSITNHPGNFNLTAGGLGKLDGCK
ncbi:MAG TPA: hypothetical protein VGF13_20805 [Verrucomicrobiae bacterium]